MTVKLPIKTKKFKSVGVNTNITCPVCMIPQVDSDSQDEAPPKKDNETSFHVSDNDSKTESSDTCSNI